MAGLEEAIIILLLIILVIYAEMINSVIEEVVNLVIQEHRKEAKIAKDVAAGMVLITTLGAVIIGSLIFFPYFIHILNF